MPLRDHFRPPLSARLVRHAEQLAAGTLRDHFRPPLSARRSWEGLHGD